jgi:hypothetical protein
LLLGLQFLRGHVQISYYTLLLLGFLTVWSLAWPLRQDRRLDLATRARRAGLMAVVVVVGFAIGAALLLPVHDYAAISTRGAGGASGGAGTAYDYATSWSLGPEDLAATLVPTAAGFGKATYLGRMPFTDYPNYLGPLLLLLALAAWFSGRRSLVLALAVATLLSVLLAMGRFSPGIYQLAYEALPYFDKFRVPSMVMVLPALLLAALAGLGIAVLRDPDRLPDIRLRRAALVVLALGAVWLLLGLTGLGEGAYRERLTEWGMRAGKQPARVLLDQAADLHAAFLVRQGLLLLAAAGAALLATRRPGFRSRWLLPVLVVLVAVDLGSVARLVTHPERSLQDVVRTQGGGGRLVPAARLVRPWSGPASVSVDPGLAETLRQTVGSDRLLPLGRDASDNAYMTAGIRSLGGYHPAKPAAREAVRQRLFAPRPGGHLARWLAAAAVTYPGTLAPEQLAMLREAGLDLVAPGQPAGGTVVYSVRDALPRARLLDRWQLVSMLPEGDALDPFLDAMAAGNHDYEASAVLDAEPQPAPETGPEALPAPEIVHDGLGEVVVAVRAPRPALLLLADLWAPGWRATVNGEPVPLLRADLILRAVALPAGEHEVRFEYRDPALRRGMLLAVVGILATLILLLVAWRRERGQTDAPAVETEG